MGTPESLLRAVSARKMSLRKVVSVTVDEADDVLLRGFYEPLVEVLRLCAPRSTFASLAEAKDDENKVARSTPSKGSMHLLHPSTNDAVLAAALRSTQVVFASATLAAEARHRIRSLCPDVELIVTSDLHKAPSTLKHSLLHVEGDKLMALLDLLKSERDESRRRGEKPEQMLIFCRGVQSCRAVHHTLSNALLNAGGYHSMMPSQLRRDSLQAFLNGTYTYLVATDIAARGLHMPKLKHIVNFDFPATSSLYLHRCGRTARMGSSGKVTSLVMKRESYMANALEKALSAQGQLHAVRPRDAAALKKPPPLPTRETLRREQWELRQQRMANFKAKKKLYHVKEASRQEKRGKRQVVMAKSYRHTLRSLQKHRALTNNKLLTSVLRPAF